jgi:uncharacterized protein YciI
LYVRRHAYDLGVLAGSMVQLREDADQGSDMEYFFYCRDRPGSGALRSELAEAHWSFMDRYAEAMIARGPTLTADEMTATGSVHIVDLPDPEAARVFAFDEPNYQAGVYGEVLVRRWSNIVGRTMWDFTGSIAGYGRFLVIGHGKPGMTAARNDLRAEHRRHLVAGGYRDRLIACGPLLSDDGFRMDGHRRDGRVTRSRLRRSHVDAGPLRAGRSIRQHRGPHLAVRRAAQEIAPPGCKAVQSTIPPTRSARRPLVRGKCTHLGRSR